MSVPHDADEARYERHRAESEEPWLDGNPDRPTHADLAGEAALSAAPVPTCSLVGCQRPGRHERQVVMNFEFGDVKTTAGRRLLLCDICDGRIADGLVPGIGIRGDEESNGA